IIVKKAYADWADYSEYKRPLHEAAIELIEIPKRSLSGKNSADIRLVVDALDLCYTKSHVDTFVIISGDSDFSPLVSKLRENNKRVIGVGVKAATSDLLAANCDEFIFYDDLVRELPAKKQRSERKAAAKPATSTAAKPKSEEKTEEKTEDRKRQQAIDLVVETVEALVTERGEDEKIWGSMVKQTLKRRKPGFSESYYGYRSFGELLEDAMKHKLLVLERDEKSGQHIIRLPAED
ncbi:MAG: NYN domain-containing protein, partial [Sulfuritalea sp.]|nr:NYN domain-containing protein [Sulfuritalea sp.]